MMIRKAAPEDAEAIWRMQNELDNETKYMMLEPGERVRDIDGIKEHILYMTYNGDLLAVAEQDGMLAGFLTAEKGAFKRIRHSAYVVTGVLKPFRGQGIGKKLFEFLDKWAADENVTRLELTVMCHNTAAKSLYEKEGFCVEGIKKRSMLVDGEYIDEYYMGKVKHDKN